MIIGTAGHIDHGKTVLIKALTGVNTDRLAEEQKRGISIDLGFAEFTLPSGRVAGVVDVPGHEAFIKNMLAGATGFDVALIVVAADDGIMPQTREHVDIINLLGVTRAVFAVTKTDLVDAEMVELVEEDIKDLIKDTPLAGSPIVPVSAPTGAGIKELLDILDKTAGELEERGSAGVFRLPIDRVFTLKGTGTVVTGTLWSGSLKPDTNGVILPSDVPVRVRSVQVHGHPVERAAAGSRVAVNLPGVNKEAVERGDVLVPAGAWRPSYMIDTEFRLLADTPAPLKNWTRVRVHHGTAEVMGRVVLLDAEVLEPGGRAYVQFRLEKPIVAVRGDRFIVRSYSPMLTIGGGEIIFGHGRRRKRFDEGGIAILDAAYAGDVPLELNLMLDRRGVPIADDELRQLTDLAPEELRPAMESLVKEGKATTVKGDKPYYMSAGARDKLTGRIVAGVRAHLAANPLEGGMNKETVKTKWLRRLDPKAAGAVLAEMVKSGDIALLGDVVTDPKHAGGAEQAKIAAGFEELLLRNGLNPPSVAELQNEFKLSAKEVQTVLAALRKDGKAIQVAPGVWLHAAAVNRAADDARAFLKEHGQMTVAEFRDAAGTSRKYAVPLLEYFDREKITRRDGDNRVLA